MSRTYKRSALELAIRRDISQMLNDIRAIQGWEGRPILAGAEYAYRQAQRIVNRRFAGAAVTTASPVRPLSPPR